MPTVLAISSHVAASRVGLGVLTPALQAFGVEVVGAPTVVYGRHPGWGPPGGFAPSAAQLRDVLGGISEHPCARRCTWAYTGYFADAAQVRTTADALADLKGRARDLKVFVDPVMGDHDTGRYVAEDVPKAIERHLLPLADVIAPNSWEAEELTGVRVIDPASALDAAKALGRPALISTVRSNGRVGAVYARDGEAWFAHAPVRDHVPRGTGDLLCGAFLGGLATRLPAEKALDAAVRLLDFTIGIAVETRVEELPSAPLLMHAGSWPPDAPRGDVRMERVESPE